MVVLIIFPLRIKYQGRHHIRLPPSEKDLIHVATSEYLHFLFALQSCPIWKRQYRSLESSTMADFQSEETMPKTVSSGTLDNEDSIDHFASSSRGKRKLGRVGSRSWFNQSLDQNTTKPVQTRTIRRQKSVTDFFQNVLSKSKSHLQDIFTLKKEKSKHKSVGGRDLRRCTQTPELRINNTDVNGAEGGLYQHLDQSLHLDLRLNSLHNSCPSFCENEEFLTHPVILKPHGSLNTDCKVHEKRQLMETMKHISPTDLSTTINMFIVAGPGRARTKPEEMGVGYLDQHRTSPSNSSTTSLVPTRDGKHQLPTLASSKRRAPKNTRLSPVGLANNTEDAPVFRRKVTNVSPHRQSVCSGTALLDTDDFVCSSKRALVKSNSDTFTKLKLSPQFLAKASSDGNCFKDSKTFSLASSMSSLGNIMISVTDYLFLGSIEAAYNEPLLCKYNISSLIDMTNLNPTLVPPNKKSDCPCACVNKTHFRSKLNIGVDDIEWENLEQYFDDINTFIHGARKNGRSVLVFSYMGQSRAAAAVIQYIMHHYKVSYNKALNVVQAKRPQTKLNSGFVKALLRLEQRLGLQDNETNEGFVDSTKSDESPMLLRGSEETLDVLSAPPVVQGAWLEC